MDQSKISMDWEEAFNQYKNIIAYQNEDLQVRATIRLAQQSYHVPEDILVRTVPILAGLLAYPPRTLSPAIQEVAAYCLNCIARQGDGNRLAEIVGQSGAITSFLRLLPHSEGSFQRVLIKCIWSLVTCCDTNRAIVARNGGLETIIRMFISCVDGTRRYLLEILSAMALSKEARRVIFSSGGLSVLVESASHGSMISRERAAQAIGLLGITRRVKRMLVDVGAVPVLVELLRVGDIPTKLVAGNALGVISAHVDHIRLVAQAGAIPLYAELLRGPDPIGREIAEDVFSILAIAEGNAVAIVEHLVTILQGDGDEAKAAAADVLWGLSGYKHSVSVVQNAGAILILIELLRNGNNEVREKVSGAIAQLSYDAVGRTVLADSGAIPVLIDLLRDDSDELRDNAAEALINFSEDPLQHGRISEAFDNPSFQSMQNRLLQIHASEEHMIRSMRSISIEQLSRDQD
ncbi:vacuolar protein 8 [Malania oleifera]|uniref:vacuolar protein 8 n=1 Tax=Malania oleifera TaxID=397392 RepID=UPI0025AE3D90|nr:vacuolar protein 8 [Malania oleifera]